MKITRKQIRRLLSEVYVQTYKNFGGSLQPSFEKAPNSLSKDMLEKFMTSSFKKNLSKMSSHFKGKDQQYINDAAFRAARADTLNFIHDNLVARGLGADAPEGEKSTHQLVDRTTRSKLIFTKKDYRDDYSYAALSKDPQTGEEYYVDPDGLPYNPDPRLLPYQSFERVIKTSQDDIMNNLKDIATYDPSPNAEAIDDYVNQLAKPDSDPKTDPVSLLSTLKKPDNFTPDANFVISPIEGESEGNDEETADLTWR
tara:strand:- start:4554 stop:5318 length:765 start_codon:yes stop_codon:yes gene_type:complete